jgi:hypothetical protein
MRDTVGEEERSRRRRRRRSRPQLLYSDMMG